MKLTFNYYPICYFALLLFSCKATTQSQRSQDFTFSLVVERPDGDLATIEYVDLLSSENNLIRVSFSSEEEAKINGYKSYRDVLKGYMSATNEDWWQDLFWEDEPTEKFLKKHEEQRLYDEKLELLSFYNIIYKNEKMRVIKTNFYDARNQNKGMKVFTVINSRGRWYIVSDIKENKLKELINNFTKMREDVVQYIFQPFMTLNPRRNQTAPNLSESLKELLEYIIPKDRNTKANGFNLTKLVQKLNEWESNNEYLKLKEIYD